MPVFYLRTTNSEIRTAVPAEDYGSADDAMKIGVAAALDIATEEIRRGLTSGAVEVCVSDLDNRVVLRSIVSLSVAPILAS